MVPYDVIITGNFNFHVDNKSDNEARWSFNIVHSHRLAQRVTGSILLYTSFVSVVPKVNPSVIIWLYGSLLMWTSPIAYERFTESIVA